MFNEEDLLPISALQHLLFCERQAALIHVERLWAENRLTVEGGQLHERAHDGPDESRPGVRITRGLELRSLELGLIGKADVVEFREQDGHAAGRQAFPVEYKRGKPKKDGSDEVQLCAQALCLEEMLGVSVPSGAFFYGRPRRRHEVAIDETLRERTRKAIERLHEIVRSGETPRVARGRKCDRCSMLNLCIPGGTGPARSAKRYFGKAMARATGEEP